MSWLLLALLAPALYSVSSFIDKYVIEQKVKSFATLTILGGCVALPFALGIFAVRGFTVYPLEQTILILLAGIGMELSLLPHYKAISLDDISTVTPVFQIIPVFVLILSYVFLGEQLTAEQFIGFWIVITGAFLLSRDKPNGTIFAIKKSFGWVMLAGILWAVPAIIFKFVTVQQGFWDALAYEFLGVSIGAFILFLIPRFGKGFIYDVRNVSGGVWGILLSNEFIYLIGRLFGFYAIAVAPAIALVSALNGTMPLFTLVFGIILSVWFPYIVKEDIRKAVVAHKLVAILLIGAGMWLINA